MRITYAAPMGKPRYNIDAGILNDELTIALGMIPGVEWNAFHNAHEAIVDIKDDSKASLVEQVISAHIANTEIREWNNDVQVQILALEAKVTQRMLRDRGKALTDIDNQIKALRLTRK